MEEDHQHFGVITLKDIETMTWTGWILRECPVVQHIFMKFKFMSVNFAFYEKVLIACINSVNKYLKQFAERNCES